MKKMPNYVVYLPYVMAIVPYYDRNNRTGTEVLYFDGSRETYSCRCEYVVEKMAMAMRTTVDVLRGRAESLNEEQGAMRKVPVVLCEGFCLIPLKMREEAERNTGTLGYVVLQFISDVQPCDKTRSRIIFKNRMVDLVVLQSKATVERQRQLARQQQELYDFEQEYWEYEYCIARKVCQTRIAEQHKAAEQPQEEEAE